MSKFFRLLRLSSFILLSLCSASVVAAQGDETTNETPVTDTSDPATTNDTSPDAPAGDPSQPAKTPAKPVVRSPKPIEAIINNDMERFIDADQIKTLLAGDSDFHVLFHDDMTGRSKGVALIIPDWGFSTTNSRGIEYLRTELGNYGWVTLAMTVPAGHQSAFRTTSESIKQPVVNDAAEQTPAATALTPTLSAPVKYTRPPVLRTVSDNFIEQYELQMKLRMLALIDEAQNYQGFFIVIAQGSSAAMLASLYAKSEIPEPEAFITLSAFMPDKVSIETMNNNIASIAVPTLDIFQSKDNRQLRANVAIRSQLAKKYFKVHYRPKELYGDISYHNQNQRLLKEIYGWLTSIGI